MHNLGEFKILESQRFKLRKLSLEDCTNDYLSWLQNDETSQKYIHAAKTTPDLLALKNYVIKQSQTDTTLFLGIFLKEGNCHIGNIKYDKISFDKSRAYMGILIGEPSWRGKGVAGEVIVATAQYLATQGIKLFILGVKSHNLAAIKAYQKIGFQYSDQEGVLRKPKNEDENIFMSWHLDN